MLKCRNNSKTGNLMVKVDQKPGTGESKPGTGESWDVLVCGNLVLVVKRWGPDFLFGEMTFADFAKTPITHVRRIILMLPSDFEVSGGRDALNLLLRRGRACGLQLFTHALPGTAGDEVDIWRMLLRRPARADAHKIAVGGRVSAVDRGGDTDEGDDADRAVGTVKAKRQALRQFERACPAENRAHLPPERVGKRSTRV